jgi:hypothetical protein
VFSQVAFLSAIVGSDAASAAAQAAISAQSRVDLNDGEIDSSISSTREEGISSALRNHVFTFFFCNFCHIDVVHTDLHINVQNAMPAMMVCGSLILVLLCGWLQFVQRYKLSYNTYSIISLCHA